LSFPNVAANLAFMSTTSTHFVHVQTQGDVTRDEVQYARAKVESALQHARDPVLFVRAKLTRLRDPAVARPAVAQVNVNVNGRFVRAQVARATLHEAVDEAHDRLRDRLQRGNGDWEAIRGGRPRSEPHKWRHGNVPTERTEFFPRPVEERQIVRHKTFALGRMTADEAAFDMGMLGYEFQLYIEDGSGSDSVLYRAADGSGYRLSQVEPRPQSVTTGVTPVTISAHGPPVLRPEQAVEHLNVTGWPFVFFRDAATDRGCVLYHRYDGHYGLITPAS